MHSTLFVSIGISKIPQEEGKEYSQKDRVIFELPKVRYFKIQSWTSRTK